MMCGLEFSIALSYAVRVERSEQRAPEPEPSTDAARGAVEAFGAGQMVVVVDRDGPDSLGLVLMPAQHANAEALRSLRTVAAGTMYLALSDARCEELGLDLAAERDDSVLRAPRTRTIAARDGIESGVTLAEHARTVSVAIDPATGRDDLVVGGHVHPLRARPGGVLERAGWTEAGVDLGRMAGLSPSAIVGEILLEDGTQPQGEALAAFAADHGLPLVTIGDLIAYRRTTERLVRRIVEADLPTRSGSYLAVGYMGLLDRREHLALVRGDVAGQLDVPVYLHLGCWEGDVFSSTRCNCRRRLDAAIEAIADAGHGVVVHLARDEQHRHEPVGRAARIRDFGVGAQILSDLGLSTLRVLSDNRRPLPGLEGFGLSVSGYQPLLGDSASGH